MQDMKRKIWNLSYEQVVSCQLISLIVQYSPSHSRQKMYEWCSEKILLNQLLEQYIKVPISPKILFFYMNLGSAMNNLRQKKSVLKRFYIFSTRSKYGVPRSWPSSLGTGTHDVRGVTRLKLLSLRVSSTTPITRGLVKISRCFSLFLDSYHSDESQ